MVSLGVISFGNASGSRKYSEHASMFHVDVPRAVVLWNRLLASERVESETEVKIASR